MPDYTELERLARAATPGPWRAHENANLTINIIGAQDNDGDTRKVALINKPHAPNAAYIAAANPAVMLELLAERRADKAEIERLRGLLKETGATQSQAVYPPQWEIGMIVEYRDSSEWAWGKGQRGVVARLRSSDIGKSGNEYQVFWTHILNRDGNPKMNGIYWTTPSDVTWTGERLATNKGSTK